MTTGTESLTNQPKKKRSTSKLKQTMMENQQPSPKPFLSDTDNIQFTMTFANENSDGSANYDLDMNEYTTSKLVEIGVIALLKQHIEQEKKPKDSYLTRMANVLKGNR